jgi:hypothetical protein
MHIEQYRYFFATAVLISTKLYGNHRYKKDIYISLACPDITILQSYGSIIALNIYHVQ